MSSIDVAMISGGAGSSLAAMFEPVADIAKVTATEKKEAVVEPVFGAAEPVEIDLAGAVDQVNQVMEAMNKGLRFHVDDTTEEMYIQVINEDTGEVISSTPPEALLDFRSRFDDWLGLVLDTEA